MTTVHTPKEDMIEGALVSRLRDADQERAQLADATLARAEHALHMWLRTRQEIARRLGSAAETADIKALVRRHLGPLLKSLGPLPTGSPAEVRREGRRAKKRLQKEVFGSKNNARPAP